MNKLIAILLYIITLISCNNMITEPINSKPVIDEIIIDSEDPKINQIIKIWATASDVDKQKLYFRWSVSRGAMTNNSEGNPIYWSTPNTVGNTVITCYVTDGIDMVTKSIGVDVTGYPEPPEEF